MHQNKNGEYVLSRREYTQLAAAVPASHATGDDGWLSGLFGGSDNDGPGLFEDTEWRHEDSHIITDPEIIDFVGNNVEVERPNEYDEAIQVRISSEVAIDGEDINPLSIGKDTPAESVITESLPNVYDHVIGSGDDIVDIINNQAVAGESAVVGPGTHVIGQMLHPPDDFYFSILGEIKLEAEANTRMISRGDDATSYPHNVVIDGHGVGVLDGNKANQTFSGNRLDHSAIWLRGDSNGVTEDCIVRDIEIREVLAGAGIEFGGTKGGVSFKPGKRGVIEGVYIHNCGDPAQNATSDGIWHGVDDHVTRDCVVRDVSDTPYAAAGPVHLAITGCVAFETGDQQMNQCVAMNPRFRRSSAVIANNRFYNGSGRCIYTFDGSSTLVDLVISNNHIGTGFSHGISDENSNGGHIIVSNNYIDLNTGTNSTGMLFDATEFVSVSGNHVSSGQNQIEFRNLSNLVCKGNVTLNGNGGVVWYENDGAVHENAIISGNYCENHSTRDVLANANMQNYVITNNILKSATAIEDSGTAKVIRDNIGYQALTTGTATVSGDGAATTFNIGLHGLSETPTTRADIYAEATPVSADAVSGAPVSCYPVDGDASGDFEDLEIKFAAAPPSGTDNVIVRWTARLATKTGS